MPFSRAVLALYRLRSILGIRRVNIMRKLRLLPFAPGLMLALLNSVLAAQTVQTVRVISRSIERKVELPGEFLPYESVPIHAKVAGFIEKVLVDRGSTVKAGQLLATTVAPELTARIAEAEAKVKA